MVARRCSAIGTLALLLSLLSVLVADHSAAAVFSQATPIAQTDACRGSGGEGLIVYQDLHFDTATPDDLELTGSSLVVIEPDGT